MKLKSEDQTANMIPPPPPNWSGGAMFSQEHTFLNWSGSSHAAMDWKFIGHYFWEDKRGDLSHYSLTQGDKGHKWTTPSFVFKIDLVCFQFDVCRLSGK